MTHHDTTARQDATAEEALARVWDEGPAVWEPWQPAVGVRVRVRVSPECAEAGHLDPNNPEEWGWLSRDTGVVVAVGDARFRSYFPGGHWYAVEMDDHRDLRERVGCGVILDPDDITPNDWYSALELSPLDPGDDRGAGEDC
jgi:hypothetical protein